MLCSNCGTDNERGFKFCVKCGSNLENPNAVNYEQVDMGGYHSEDDFSAQKSGYSIGTGTFTINDRSAPSDSALYTADELNDTDEEFDFSMYEDSIPTVDTHAAVPPQPQVPQPLQQSVQPAVQQPVVMPQSMGVPPFMGARPVMMAQPQIIGYDPNGVPIYGQAQPVMMAQPQIIGYDANGMPIYGQAAAGAAMIYSEPVMNQSAVFQGTPQPAVSPVHVEETAPPDTDSSDDFWAFFDGGKGEHREENDDDFFSKSSHIMQEDPFRSGHDEPVNRHENQAPPEMGDMPIADGSRLMPNDPYRFHKHYMAATETVNAADLEAKVPKKPNDLMAAAAQADAEKLAAKMNVRSRYSMESAGEADPEQLATFVPKRSSSLMDAPEKAVEALPKHIDPYESELDKIELPEHMKAKKTRRTDNIPEIPSIPGLE